MPDNLIYTWHTNLANSSPCRACGRGDRDLIVVQLRMVDETIVLCTECARRVATGIESAIGKVAVT